MRKTAVGFATLILVLVSGCATYKEELQILKDDSGTLSFTSGVVEMFGTESEVNYHPDGIEGYRIVSVNSYADDGFDWTEAIAHFDSIDALAEVVESSAGLVGRISYEEDGEGNMVFLRDLTPVRDLIRVFTGGEEPTEEMVEEELGELAFLPWSFTVQFEGRILDTNALPENIDESTNTVSWFFTFRDLVDTPQIMCVTVAQ